MLDHCHAALQAVQTDRCHDSGCHRGGLDGPDASPVEPISDGLDGIRKVPTWQSYVGIAQSGVALSLWMLTLAYLVMRLIPPRPPRSDLIRQPGMLLLGLMIGLMILLMFLSTFVPLVAWTNVIIALALGLSWLAACRRYRSRAELGWIEGIGRFVGVGWIVTTAAIYPLYLLMA